MKLVEIFNQLRFGELSQISLGGQEAGVINESNWEQVISHINMGLIDLYKRFNLKEGRFSLLLQPGQMTYSINSAFAVNNQRSREPVRYILDSVSDPFKDDVNKIERVYAANNHEMDLNNVNNEWSVFTPSQLVLRIPYPIVGPNYNSLPRHFQTHSLDVVYRAGVQQIVIPIGYFDPERVEVEIPHTHLQALLLYVASRVNNPIGMVNEFNAGNNYAAKYEMECARLLEQGLNVDKGGGNDRLRRNGWI